MLLLMLTVCGIVNLARAADIPDKYKQLHDKAATDAAAFKQLQAMANKGDAEAEYCLAGLYNPGESLCKVDVVADDKVTTAKEDYKVAAKWYRKAAVQGNGYAADALAELYIGVEGIPEDMVQAAQWWMVAIDVDPDGGGFNANIAFNAVKSDISQEQMDKARDGADKIEAQIMKHKPAATPAPAAAS
jgi:hypothetical protein